MEVVKWMKVQAERVGAAVCIALGAVSLLLGWLGVSDKIYPGEQIPYIASGGLLGVCLVGIGAVLWLSADLRDEWRKLDRIEELMQSADLVRAVEDHELAAGLDADALEHHRAERGQRRTCRNR